MHKSISRNENEIYDVKSGTPTLGGRRGSFPSALIHGVQEGQESPFILNSFQLSYLLKRHFLAL